MKIGLVLVVVLLATPAFADNPANWVPKWSRAVKPKASPTAPIPVPASRPPEKPAGASASPQRTSEPQPPASPGKASTQRPAATAKPRTSPKSQAQPIRQPRVQEPPPSGGGQRTQPPAEAKISCSRVQMGAGSPCWIIRANEGEYEAYSLKQKCQARACLSAAQIKYIKSCFPDKKPEPRC